MVRFVVGLCWLAIVASGAVAHAQAPEYNRKPFGETSVKSAPLIEHIAFPTARKFELGLMFSGSVVDKYTEHLGAMLDLSYHLTDTMGIATSFGFMHGGLTSTVTDRQGGILAKGKNSVGCQGAACNNFVPNLPDYKQITGIWDALFVWAPLYGKINVVSEFALNLQLYGIIGLGVNGTRTISANIPQGDASNYQLQGNGAFQGGIFSDPKFHVTGGAGLKIFILKWLALRTEFRAIAFRDSFEFKKGAGPEGYTLAYWFAQGGVSFLF